MVYPLIQQSGLIDEATGKPVMNLAIDDMTVGRCGKHVAHAGWFKDASASGSSHRGTVIHWAHNWIVGAVTLRYRITGKSPCSQRVHRMIQTVSYALFAAA